MIRLVVEINNIVFYDDLIDNSFDLNVLIKDYNLFTEKCKSLNINYNFGDITNKTQFEYYYSNTIKKQLITNDIIHSQIIDDLYKYNVYNYIFCIWSLLIIKKLTLLIYNNIN